MGKSVFFIGHREASGELLPILSDAIETHISKYGASEFIVGNYGGFDHLVACAVIAAKKTHPISHCHCCSLIAQRSDP